MTFYHLNPRRGGEQLARELEQFDDYRVLRRLPRPDEMWCRSMPVPENVIKLAIVDCETTGLDPERHRMIEFAVGTLSIDADTGDVVDVTPPKAWLEDSAEDLSIEIERLTHITSDMLVGKQFPDAAITEAFAGVTAVVAHNARFDQRVRDQAVSGACQPALGLFDERGRLARTRVHLWPRDRCASYRRRVLPARRASRRRRRLGDDMSARVQRAR